MADVRRQDRFRASLFAWFQRARRDLPWRRTRDPYRILVAEVMLQQTQVSRVAPKYRAFLRTFPTLRVLSRATPADVIRSWSGLGYNRRALNLLSLSRAVVRRFDGRVPRDPEALRQLPGVGAYTANAVAAFAFSGNVAAIDTNVSRVVARYFLGLNEATPAARQRIDRIATSLVPPGRAWAWNHAMMDFGALVCLGPRPRCEACPVRAGCWAYPRVLRRRKPRAAGERFLDSRRYVRGRIVESLRRGRGATLKGLRVRIGVSHPRFAAALRQLVRDGLVRVERRPGHAVRVRLPTD